MNTHLRARWTSRKKGRDNLNVKQAETSHSEVDKTAYRTLGQREHSDSVDCLLDKLGDLQVLAVTRFGPELNVTWKRLMTHRYLRPCFRYEFRAIITLDDSRMTSDLDRLVENSNAVAGHVLVNPRTMALKSAALEP
jgi:hypothetical protein